MISHGQRNSQETCDHLREQDKPLLAEKYNNYQWYNKWHKNRLTKTKLLNLTCLPPSAHAFFLLSNLSTSLSLLKMCLFLELIEPKAPLLAHGFWGALYKYSNTIQYNYFKRLCLPMAVEGRYINTSIHYNTIQYLSLSNGIAIWAEWLIFHPWVT